MTFIVAGSILIILSLYFRLQDRIKLSLALLIAAGMAYRLFSITIDPFLNTWDEQFHALVSKNISDGFFNPLLYTNPILDYDYKDWSANHIWLHKQPLFLWIISLSVKLFGNTVIAVRLPGLLLSVIMIPVIYKTGSNIINSNTGFYAALIYTTSFFNINFVSGQTFTDHNDVFFTFFVSCSIWAYTEYYRTKNRKWIVIIGLMCGMAVMVKWLAGMLFFIAWFIHIILQKNQRKQMASYIHLTTSAFIAFALFLPWQIYAYINFPDEYKHEYMGMINHFLNIVEGHGGGPWYHFSMMKVIYHSVFLISALVSIVLIVVRRKVNDFLFLFIYLMLVYAFFTMAATKMPAFTLIACICVYIIIAYLPDEIMKSFMAWKFFRKSCGKLILVVLLTALCYINLKPFSLFSYHAINSDNKYLNEYRMMKLYNTTVFREVVAMYPHDLVLFNCIYPNHIEIMFYGDQVAYPFIPSEDQIFDIRKKGYKIGVFNRNLPDYIEEDSAIVKIDKFIIDQPK